MATVNPTYMIYWNFSNLSPVFVILYHRFIIQNILEKFIGILSIKYHFPSYIIKHLK